MPKKSDPPMPAQRAGAQKKRPTSAGASRPSGKPASASRQKAPEDERAHLRAEVARLEALAGANKQAPAPQQALSRARNLLF